MRTAVIPLILEQHAQEAAFLWILHSRAVHAPHYQLYDLAKLDQRVEAHLDGLRIGGDEGWRWCVAGLESGEAGEVFAAAVLALASRDSAKLGQVYAIAEECSESVKGLIAAFGWVEPWQLSGTVKALLNSRSAFHRQIGVAACALHRVNPGAILEEAVRAVDQPSALQARILRTVGEIKRRDLIYDLRPWFRVEDMACRFWAAWSAVLLGDREEALDILKALVLSGSEFSPRALPVLLRAMPVASAYAWLKALAQHLERQRELTIGTGMTGDPLYIPWLINQMQAPALARLAGEAFSLITGVDIAYEGLEGDRPEGFDSGPTENPEDELIALDPDEDLPWPDPNKIERWWETHQGRFPAGGRYLCGAPSGEAPCWTVLRDGYQRQRAAAALALALIQPAAPLFEVRAPGGRQRRWLQHTS